MEEWLVSCNCVSRCWTTAGSTSLSVTNVITTFQTRDINFNPRGTIVTLQVINRSPHTLLEKNVFLQMGWGVVCCDALFLISINYQHPSGEAKIKILIWQTNGNSFMYRCDSIQSHISPKANISAKDQLNCPFSCFFKGAEWLFDRNW